MTQLAMVHPKAQPEHVADTLLSSGPMPPSPPAPALTAAHTEPLQPPQQFFSGLLLGEIRGENQRRLSDMASVRSGTGKTGRHQSETHWAGP